MINLEIFKGVIFLIDTQVLVEENIADMIIKFLENGGLAYFVFVGEICILRIAD